MSPTNKQVAQLMIEIASRDADILQLQTQLDIEREEWEQGTLKLVEVARQAKSVRSSYEMGNIKGGAFYDLKIALDALESGDQY